MAFEHGIAGESVRQIAAKRHFFKVLIILIFIIIIFWGITMAGLSFFLSGNMEVYLIIAAIVLFPIVYWLGEIGILLKIRERWALKGAIAEETVSNIICQLGNEYAVFHDIKSPYGNIDHVVINQRNCVFLIETKSHNGKITCKEGKLLRDGKPTEKDFIRQTLNNTYWLKDEILRQLSMNLFINAVIVFENAFVPNYKIDIGKVTVINTHSLIRELTKYNEGHKYGNDFRISGLFNVLFKLQNNREDITPIGKRF